MTRVVLIGITPDAVDLTDPDLPPGITREQIAAGIETALADMRRRGWQADFCSILPDDTAEAAIAKSLATPCDCVVIGGGIRIPSAGLLFFERVVNAVGKVAPGVPIAFNTRPENSGEAAARWIGQR